MSFTVTLIFAVRPDFKRMLFIVDFDGTIAPRDSVDAMLERFADPAWKDIEEQWASGRMNSRDCMRSQLGLVSAAREVLDEFFQSIATDPAFPEFVRYVSGFAEVAVVSDGLDYPIGIAMKNCGVPSVPVYANALEFRADRLGLAFPHAETGCPPQSGVCKCGVARTLDGGRGLETVLIGDGRSDQCIAHIADRVFARGGLRNYCRNEGIAHTPFETFSDVLAEVRKWDTHRPIRRQRGKSCRIATH